MEVKTNPFYELRNRLYSSAAAGCSLIAEDFRLQRAIEAFKPMSETNKVFGRLYNMCSALTASGDPASEIADCIALADALAVTQGAFSDESETSPAQPVNGINPAYLSYKQLCEYKNKIYKTPHSRQNFGEDFFSAVRDPRLLSAFLSVSGADSVYIDELSTIFESVYGEDLIQPLIGSIDLTAPKATGKQIKYICRIAGANQNQLYISLAENEDNPQGVRIAAIEAMTCTHENEDILLTLYKTEKGKIKNAALMSLARINSPAAEEPLKKLLAKYKPANMAFAAASGGKTATEYTRAAVDYVINNNVAFDDKEHPNIFVVESLLSNKKDIADCFLKIGEYFMKDYSPSLDGSDFVNLNQPLISNLYNHSDVEYIDMIKLLHHKYPEVYFSARFYLELTRNPKRACGIMNCEPKKYDRIMLRYLGNIFTTPDGWYRLPCTTSANAQTSENTRLFTSIPDDILNFLTDTSEICEPSLLYKRFPLGRDRDIIHANINGRCTVLDKLLKICTPADRSRVKQAAEKFAWAMNEACPTETSVNILGGCTDRPLEGIIQNFVTYTLLNTMHRAPVYVLAGLKVPEELLISELKALMKKLPSLSSKVEKVKLNAQINEISRLLSKHGIIY